MALSSDLDLTQTTRSQIPDGNRWRFAGETDSSPDIARPSVSLPTAVNSVPIAGDITYPKGGCAACLVVSGSRCLVWFGRIVGYLQYSRSIRSRHLGIHITRRIFLYARLDVFNLRLCELDLWSARWVDF